MMRIYIASSSGNKTVLDLQTCSKTNERLLTLLRQEQVEAALQCDALARPLVIGREAGGMRRLGDLAVGDLLEGVEAVAAGVEGVHQMHDGRLDQVIWRS